MLFVHKVWNAAFFKNFPRICAINGKVSGQNGKILVTHLLLTHHAADQTYRFLELRTWGWRYANINTLLFQILSGFQMLRFRFLCIFQRAWTNFFFVLSICSCLCF